MATMLNIYDRQTRKKTAVLQNAFNIVETHELNQIYLLTFSLPSTDEKNKFCLPRHFVRWGNNGELYRIKSPKISDSNTGIITYECEHVITTLCDSIMFGSFQYGGAGVKTRATITWLLSQQKQQDWVLDVCDFDRKFEYLWEQENILNALYSIPKEFASPYMWTFDTTVYPWKLSLRAINTTAKPEFYLRARSNILSSGTSADYANICTRIYPLGYGEGVNQLNIKDVNNGVPYLQSPPVIVAQYGIVEKVLVDRRFENAESLKAYAQSMLDVYQTPTMSRSFDVTDLYPLTNYDWNKAEVGKICKMTQDGSIAYITKTQWQRDLAGDLHIDLSTKATDIASSVADLADRVRIESVYAQGATQLYQHSKDANATPQKGMIMSLYFPSEMRQINKVLMRLKLNKFRSYSQTTESNGGYKQTLSVAEESKTIESQTNTEDASVTVKQSSVDITSQTNTEDTSVTVKQSSIDITSQTNTGDESVTVKQSSVNITSQTNTEDSSVTIRQESIDITSQTNTEDSSVTIQSQSKIATTDMTADADQTLTTTQGGGGVGTTSTSSNTLSGTATADAVWEYDTDTVMASTGYGQMTDDFNQYRSDTTSWNASTDTPEPYSGGEGHYHGFYRPFHHEHTLSDIRTYFDRGQIAHSHNVNLSGTGSHNHTFSIGPHTHDLHIAHQHKVTIPAQTITVPCPKHKHNITIPSQTLKVPCPKHRHAITIPSQTLKVPCPKHKHNIVIPSQTLNIPCPKHKHNITIPSQILKVPCPKHKHNIVIPSQTLKVPCPKHKHNIVIPSQTLTIPCPKHKHSITIPGWSKTIEIAPHTHGIKAGIYESGNPTSFDIYVSGKRKATVNATSYDGDIVTWLLNDKNQVPRNSWIDIEIRPNDLAYVVSSVFVQGFVQSRGGGNY